MSSSPADPVRDAYTLQERQTLLQIARASIAEGLRAGRPLRVEVSLHTPALQLPRATFVTLERDGELRGCIGTLQAYQPLVADVAEHAFAAAFRDPRFPPLASDELADLDIHLSILTPEVPLDFRDEADLLAQLRPGVDGLTLRWQHHQGTFLPAVWESLPAPRDFLHQLKRKAGLPSDFWATDVRISRYEALRIDDEAPVSDRAPPG